MLRRMLSIVMLPKTSVKPDLREGMNDKEFFYDIVKFEVQTIAQRNSFLLIFQSMLFAATAVVATAENQVFIPIWVLMILGFVLSLIWVYLNWLTHVIEVRAMEKLEEIDERVRFLLEARKTNWLLSKGSVSAIVTFLIPSVMVVCWAVLMGYYLAQFFFS